MAGAAPKRSTRKTDPRQPAPRFPPSRDPPPPNVHPAWILSAVGGALLLGLVCTYITLCGLFYYGQWQLVLHPSRTVSATPSSIGLPFSEVHFGTDITGQPQLDGWWIPSQLPTDPTVLLLHGASGSMSDALPAVRTLHNARLNVLLFDYRGYGRSAGKHPTEASMEQDAQSAFDYLNDVRQIPPPFLLVYGRGLGGSLATLLCTEHPQIAGLILNSPQGDIDARRLDRQHRARLIPVGMLFHERFPLADRLHALHTPKLLITWTRDPAPTDLRRAGDPKTTVEIPTPDDSADVTTALRRFLNTYILRIPAELKPQLHEAPHVKPNP